MECMEVTGHGQAVPENTFWNGKKVFITGHTGFKGSWLCLWLHSLGAQVHGYALAPPTDPSLFQLCRIEELVQSTKGDVRDRERLNDALFASQAEIVIHMAAQPLVRDSYKIPVDTYEVNVLGTVNLLDGVRKSKTVKAVINVTTDKCYENKEWVWGYRENDQLGGYDPYSSSKACSELVTAAYRSSFFNPLNYASHGVAIASVRAGNVIGGGDWAADRLIPDCIRAILTGKKVIIRNPDAIRPWQHVLEPLTGYLLVCEKLYQEGPKYGEAWNFGPDDSDAKPVRWIVENLCARWGKGASFEIEKGNHPHETRYLKLDCAKAKQQLGWYPRWNLQTALHSIEEWTQAYAANKMLREVSLAQIAGYTGFYERKY